MSENEIFAFVILSIPIIYFSRRVIFKPGKHGFPRFFSWECMALLFIKIYRFWFIDPFSLYQLVSWIFLIYSATLAGISLIWFFKYGKSDSSRKDEALFGFEKTTVLIKTGIYRYIRHPMYGSLLFLTLGMLFKQISDITIVLAGTSSVLLAITAKIEERENIAYFGDNYKDYMHQSKMFIPFIL